MRRGRAALPGRDIRFGLWRQQTTSGLSQNQVMATHLGTEGGVRRRSETEEQRESDWRSRRVPDTFWKRDAEQGPLDIRVTNGD